MIKNKYAKVHCFILIPTTYIIYKLKTLLILKL